MASRRWIPRPVYNYLRRQNLRWRSPAHRTLRREQVQLAYKAQPSLVIVNIAHATLLLGTFWVWVDRLPMLLWYGLVVGASLIQLWVWRRRRKSGKPLVVTHEGQYRKSIFRAAFYGLLWGTGGLILFVPDSFPHQMFLALILGSMATGVSTTLAALPAVRNTYIVTVTFPLALKFLFAGSYPQLAMGVTVLVLMTTLTLIVRPAYQRFLELIQTKTELETTRSNLLDAIESSSEAFALFDTLGRPVVANSKYRDLFGPPEPLPANMPLEENIRRLGDGRWVKSTYRRTATGGVVSVHADITDLKQREKSLRHERDAAESANQTKSEFLALMSHELRTPLNAIIGFADMLRENRAGAAQDPEKIAEYTDYIHQSGSHLLNLINDILDLSKIEAGKYQLVEEEISLSDLIENICALMSATARDGYVSLVNEVPSDAPRLFADERALRQMLLNMISNAIKFTEPGGTVTIRAQACENGYVISVIDTGIGISEEDIEMVMEPFRQVENHLNRKSQGTGLGIPLVCRLAALHDGSFTLCSTPGKGTTASLHFNAERILPPAKSRVRKV